MAGMKVQADQQAAIQQGVDTLTKGAAAAQGVGDAAQSLNASGLLSPAGGNAVGPMTKQ